MLSYAKLLNAHGYNVGVAGAPPPPGPRRLLPCVVSTKQTVLSPFSSTFVSQISFLAISNYDIQNESQCSLRVFYNSLI